MSVFPFAWRGSALALVFALACSRKTPTRETAPPPFVDAHASEARVGTPLDAAHILAPLESEWLIRVEEGGARGFVSPPSGATNSRPMVIAIHGAGDRPDWACGGWRGIFGPYPFIICPRGTPLGAGGFFWPSIASLDAAITSSVDAAARRYAPYLMVAEPRLYVGFSRGAIMGPEIIAAHPELYRGAIFLEGLGDVTSRRFVEAFKNGGGRVLLACSQGGCDASRKIARDALVRFGIEARVNYAGHVGHTIDERVTKSVRRDIGWLLEKDPIWEPVVRDHEREGDAGL